MYGVREKKRILGLQSRKHTDRKAVQPVHAHNVSGATECTPPKRYARWRPKVPNTVRQKNGEISKSFLEELPNTRADETLKNSGVPSGTKYINQRRNVY